MLGRMNLEDFRAASSPKVVGRENLIKALEGQSLDFFLMLSSSASILGHL